MDNRGKCLLRKNTVKILLPVMLLVIADQAVKLIIQHNYLNLHFDIIGGFLYFEPLHNIKLSWINSLLGTNVGFLPHIITNVIIMILLMWAYRYAGSLRKIPSPVRYSYTFILAGALCSVTDKLFWGGSLDFIGLFTWFIFDTKDLYITTGVTIFAVYTLIYSIKNPNAADGGTKDDMQMIRGFAGFIREDVRRFYIKAFGRHAK